MDHHDDAYAWGERRKTEHHPKTGAAQLIELREAIEEIRVRQPIQATASAPAKPPILAHVPDEDLLGYGVPSEWLEEVRGATEDSLCDLTDHLPQEAAEALLDLATGVTPHAPTVAASLAE